MIKRWLGLIIAFIFLLGFAGTAFGLEPFQVKEYVTDQARLLSENERSNLSRQLYNYAQATGNQLLVVTVPSLEGEDITDFTQRMFEENQPGQKGKDNGLILLIAPQERKLWISVGYGLEEAIPDGKAGAIRDRMFSYFRSGDFDSGVNIGVALLINSISPDYKIDNLQPVQTRRKQDRSLPFAFIVAIIFVIISFLSNLGRGATNTRRRISRGYSEPWYWGGGGGFGGGSSGGFGGGSSGGGFSGGGGSFGGGGAGGSW